MPTLCIGNSGNGVSELELVLEMEFCIFVYLSNS